MYTDLDDPASLDETSLPATAWGSGLVVDEDFVREHRPFVRRTLLRIGVAASEVDDQIQEVFLAAMVSAQRFEAGRSPRAWLYGIAVNIARSQRRRRHRFGYTFAEPPEMSVAPNQERGLEYREARSLVHRALDELPKEQRDVVVLHRLEGWPINLVAEAVGCPVATAHSRLRLGTARLGRVVRGNVVRGRMAAIMAALASALGWPPAAAAATATAMLVLGTWATVATLEDDPQSGEAAPPTSSSVSAAVMPSPGLPTPPVIAPPEPVDIQHVSDSLAPSLPRTASTRSTSASAGEGQSAPVVESGAVAQVPVGESPSAQRAGEAPPTGGTVLEETRLLGRARTIALSSPDAARDLLQRYDARFPDGELRRERDAIAALLRE